MTQKPMTTSEAGKLGAKARNKKLTAAQRSEIAKKAVDARETRRKAKH